MPFIKSLSKHIRPQEIKHSTKKITLTSNPTSRKKAHSSQSFAIPIKTSTSTSIVIED